MILSCNVWIIFTLSLYQFGFNSDFEKRPDVAAFVLVCLVVLNFGYYFGRKMPGFYRLRVFPSGVIRFSNAIYCVSAFVFLLSSVYLFSTQVSYSAFDVLSGAVSNPYVYRQESLNLGHAPIRGSDLIYYFAVLAKAFSFFPVLVGVYLFFSRDDFSLVGKTVVFAFAVSQLYGALLKGSSKEVFDLFFVLAFFWFIGQKNGLKLRDVIKVLAIVFGVLLIFLYQQLTRAGIEFANIDFIYLFQFFSDYVVSYLTQGYYGLSLVFGESADFSYGLGHLDVLRNILFSAGLIPDLFLLADEADRLGWEKGLRWSSMYIGLINDFGWLGVLLYLYFVGFLFGAAVKTLRSSENAYAAILLLLISYLLFFSSMNFQIGLALHWTFAYLVFVFSFPFLLKGGKT